MGYKIHIIFTLQGIYCRKKLIHIQSNDDIHFIYFYIIKNKASSLPCWPPIFRYTAYNFFRCIPSASPAHENRKKGSILLCFNIITKYFSAKRVIYIIIYLFFTLQQLKSEVSLFMTDFYIERFPFYFFPALHVITLSLDLWLLFSILHNIYKFYKIIWPLMERFGVLHSSPSPASPSSTPSRSP